MIATSYLAKPFRRNWTTWHIERVQDTLPQYDRFVPDVAIVNWYDSNAKLGMHTDRSESAIVRNA